MFVEFSPDTQTMPEPQADISDPVSIPLEKVTGLPDQSGTPFDRAEAALDVEILYSALGELPYRNRLVLVLNYGILGEEVALTKIAGMTGVSVKSVRNIRGQGLSTLAGSPTTQALRETPEPLEPPSETQQTHKTNQGRQEFIRKYVIGGAERAHKRSQGSPLLQQLMADEAPHTAALAYLIQQELRDARDNHDPHDPGASSPVDKYALARQVERRHLPTLPSQAGEASLNHVDYIQALGALERVGMIDCYRNERGSVIEAVALRDEAINSP